MFAQSGIGITRGTSERRPLPHAGHLAGAAVLGVSVVLLAVNWRMGIRVGWGTSSSGHHRPDRRRQAHHLIPAAQNLSQKLLMVACGLMVLNVATYFYVGAGLGAGPREGLMIGIVRRTGWSVRFTKSGLELSAILAGTLLGGRFGIAPVIVALVTGPRMNLTFDLGPIDITSVPQVYLDDQLRIRERGACRRK
ncbi:MAG: YczE/YyaS/YitT family protein [Anaerotruncus massiliensis (ex Togo et al. 2019)]